MGTHRLQSRSTRTRHRIKALDDLLATKSALQDNYVVDLLSDKLQNLEIRKQKRDLLKAENAAKKQETLRGVSMLKKNRKIEGDMILERIRNMLAKRYLTKNQNIIMEILIAANLENIYGAAFKDNELRIKKENNIQKIRPFALIGVPRRNGKTFAVAWFVAVCLVYMKNVNCAIFAPSFLQAEFFLKEVKAGLRFIQSLGVEVDLITNAVHEICVRSSFFPKAANKITALGSKSDTSRGISANIVIADELSFMATGYITSVILPLLTVSKTAFIGISTVNGEENHFFKFLSMQNPDDPSSPIEVFQFYGACFDCRHSGKADSCKHMVNEQPEWITSTRKKDVGDMYAALGGEDMARQEIMGMVKQENENAFEEAHITRFFDKEHIVDDRIFTVKPSIIFSVIDPTGGGQSSTGSHLAINTFIFDAGRMVIVGHEAISGCKGSVVFPYIKEHYETVRKIPICKDLPIGLWVEGNGIWIYYDIVEFIEKTIPKLTVFDKTYADTSQLVLNSGSAKSGETGQITNAQVKQQMWKLTREYMAFDRIYFYKDFVTIKHPKPLSGMSARDAVRGILQNELMNYFIIKTPPQNPFSQRVKVAFSGKTSKSEGKDDNAVVLQLSCVVINRFIVTGGMQKLFDTSRFY